MHHSPFPVICLTCRHLVLRFFRVAIQIDYYPECAMGLPEGGRAITCAAYEREPGSDDEPIQMARNPTPSVAPRHPIVSPRPAAPEGSEHYPFRGSAVGAIRRYAETEASPVVGPGRWRVVGVAT